MDQIKPVLGRRGPRASCWKVTITATVVGGVTALYLGILLGECIARHVHLLQRIMVCTAHSNGSHTRNPQKHSSEDRILPALLIYSPKLQRLMSPLILSDFLTVSCDFFPSQ